MMSRLLLVDGDPKSLRVLDVSLRGAGYEVETAANGVAALAALERAAPDLVIADTQLADIDGFELGGRMRAHLGWSRIPLLFLASDPTIQNRIRGFEAGADDYLVKPAFVKEVVARVRALLRRNQRERLSLGRDGDEKFAGQLAEVTVVDLLEIVDGSGRSGVVHLTGPAGVPGAIYFRQGKVVDAEVGRLSGAAAIFRLLAWTEGAFEVEFRSIRRRDVIEKPPAELVVEGMERLDEWNRLLHQLPSPTAVLEVDYRQLAERLAEIPDEVNGLLRLFDGTRSVTAVVEDSGFPDMEALSAVTRLYAEGIIYDVASRPPEPQRSTSPGLGGWLSDATSPFRSALMGEEAQGAVRQSFAERLEVEGQGRPAEEHGDSSGGGSLRRRTEPGLGLAAPVEEIPSPRPVAAAASDEAAIPHLRAEPDNVIRFPSQEPADLAAPAGESPSAPHRSSGQLAVAGEIAVADGANGANGANGDRKEVAPAAVEPAAASPEAIVARLATEPMGPGGPAPLSLISTHPGIGPSPAAAAEEAWWAAAPPEAAPVEAAPSPSSPVGRPSLDLRMDVGELAPQRERSVEGGGDRDRATGDGLGHSQELDAFSFRPSRARRIAALVGGAALVGVLLALLIRQIGGDQPHQGSVVAALPPAPPGSVPASKPPVTGALTRATAPTEGRAAPPPSLAPPPVPAGAVAAAPAPAVELPGEAAPSTTAAIGQGAPAAAKDVELLLSDCRAAFARGKMRAAVTACTAAVEAAPKSAEALAMLAHTQLNVGNASEALTLAEHAVALNPALADAYVIMGGVLQDSGRHQDAKAAYTRYLELAPKGRYADELKAIVRRL